MIQRGVYANPIRGKQSILFVGMQWGNITPTDIDAAIEYKDRARVFVEVKGHGVKVPVGQVLLLERFVHDFQRAGKDAIAIVAEHDVDDPTKDIIAADCKVREIFYPRTYGGTDCRWRKPTRPQTLNELVNAYLGAVDDKIRLTRN